LNNNNYNELLDYCLLNGQLHFKLDSDLFYNSPVSIKFETQIAVIKEVN